MGLWLGDTLRILSGLCFRGRCVVGVKKRRWMISGGCEGVRWDKKERVE